MMSGSQFKRLDEQKTPSKIQIGNVRNCLPADSVCLPGFGLPNLYTGDINQFYVKFNILENEDEAHKRNK